jgi:N-formylglutamate deformylase
LPPEPGIVYWPRNFEDPMTNPVFSLTMPEARTSCAVFNSPHSGSAYPHEFMRRTRLDRLQMRSSEDAFVDELFGGAPAEGAPLLAAETPRAWVDFNRACEDLDPALIAGASRRFVNPRIAAGLGVIPRVVAEGRPIIEGKLTLSEARARLDICWRPYHRALQDLLRGQRDRFGVAILFDCHSMPHDALASAPVVWGRRPDIVLGDRFGAACARWLVDAATEMFADEGFAVARNAPFAGGYITQAYGRPRQGYHALQIEIDRSLYMDETTIEKRTDFEDVRMRLGRVISELVTIGPHAMPVAAE